MSHLLGRAALQLKHQAAILAAMPTPADTGDAVAQEAAAAAAVRPTPLARLESVWQSCRRSLQTDWHYNDDYDRFYWPLAVVVYGSYAAKLGTKLAWGETAQNLGMMCGLVLLALLSSLRPAAYRRHGALLRMGLLTYGYTMPVLTSTQAMHAFTPAPSTVPVLGGLVDTYSLWLSTRNAFLAWAVVGCRPPLYLAVPYQLMGLWRVTAAGFCAAPVLQHPVMQRRTEAAHLLLDAGLVGVGGSVPWRLLLPPSPEKRCASLLLFYNVLFAFLAPLLLLVPLKRQALAAAGAGGSGRVGARRGTLHRVEAGLESCLRLLVPQQRATRWEQHAEEQGTAAAGGSGAGPAGQQAQQQLEREAGPHGRTQQWQREVQDLAAPSPLATVLVRWWVVLAVLWTLCCVLYS